MKVTSFHFTTISAIASGAWLFATHPDEYEAVRADPGLVTNAMNETLRLETPIQYFSRVTTREVDWARASCCRAARGS